MTKFSLLAITLATAIAFLIASAPCRAQAPQDQPQDHSCTISGAGSYVAPSGTDGHDFSSGWGVQAGVGFAVTHRAEPGHGAVLYIGTNYMYDRLDATATALDAAKTSDPAHLMNATSAHGSFSALTLDPTLRYSMNIRTSVYALGGFGWFRRGVGFSGANPGSLTDSSGSSLERLASDSGVFDAGAGVNFGLTPRGGVMLYAEVRVYRGLAVNNATTLVPLSAGIRW
jgi:hypothetical protein